MKTLGSAAALVLVGLSLLVGNVGAQTLNVLHWFGSTPNDGINPQAVLMQGSDGNFYGTTSSGGTNGDGNVFRISPSGSFTSLYSFGRSLTDGQSPDFGLVQASDGNFYSTTGLGGSNNEGTVFRISPSGTETTLYQFGSTPIDGQTPSSGLVQGSDGNFYGTTYYGGITNWGTVFRTSPSGSYTSLYSFGSTPSDGENPVGGVIQGSDGNFYGTTYHGGTNGDGSVFRISPSGYYTNLYSFVGSPGDGANPNAGVVQGSDGDFYGTTLYGGAANHGTVFRINPSGVYTSLYSFIGQPFPNNYGFVPFAGLVQGSDGNFYGTTVFSSIGYGSIFRTTPTGNLTYLYFFQNPTNGKGPVATVVQGADGSFYGTAEQGGTSNSGTIFKLTVPLNQPANQISAVQPVGNDMAVSLPSVAGETYQLQFTTDLTSGNWSNVAGVSVTNSIGALMTLTNFGGALLPRGFYRFDITP